MNIRRNEHFPELSAASTLTVLYDGFVATDETWRQKPLPAPYSRLYYVIGGSGMLISATKSMRLEPGYVYLAPCGLPCGFYGTDSVTKVFFHVNVILPDGYDLFAEARQFARLARSAERLGQIKAWYLSDNPVDHIFLKGEIWETVSAFAEMIVPFEARRTHHSEQVRNAIAYIRKNLSASLTVKTVAGAVFTSETTLGTLFRRELGSTVARYIEDLVFFEARKRLLAQGSTIGEISVSLGFSDQFYFSRRFREKFGVSPREYRKARTGT